MTMSTNKNRALNAQETAKSESAIKTRKPISSLEQKPCLFPVPVKYELVWQSLQSDWEGVPEETLITEIYRRPSKTEVEELKKQAHARGWFLASYFRKPYYPVPDEF